MKKPFNYIISAAVIALIILLIWLFLFKKWETAKPDKIQNIEKQIDSAHQIQKTETDSFIKISDRDAKKSTSILKSLKHEKIIVRDTTYNAMCKYIEDYRPAK